MQPQVPVPASRPTLATADIVASLKLRRISGAGPVRVTLDGGQSWVDVEPIADRLAASLKRCAFLLDSSRLVITDPVARAIAAEATAEARTALAAHDAGAAS